MSKQKMSEKTFVGLLSRVVTEEEFSRLHDELSDLFENYYKNSWEENSSFCCQLIEDHAKLQGDLFRLLKLSTEQESDNKYEALQNRLLPWLCNGFVCSGDISEDMANLREEYESRIGNLDDQLKDAEQQIASLQIELQQATMVIDKRNQELHKTYENLVKLKLENSDLCGRLTRRFPLPKSLLSLPDNSFKNRATEELDLRLIGLSCAQSNISGVETTSYPEMEDFSDKLVKRFGEIYTGDRVVLMETLEGLNDRDTNERLVFNIVESCFCISKQEQKKMRNRITEALQPSSADRMDDERLTEIVENFMKKNTENFNTETLLSDVFKCVRRKYSSLSTISFNETLFSEFTSVLLDVIWFMVSLNPPVYIASAHDGEMIKESCYRRSYMSEFSSTIIHHYIWPCLLRERRVIKKGEVVTRRISIYNDVFISRKNASNQRLRDVLINLLRITHNELPFVYHEPPELSPTRPQSAEPYFTSLQLNEESGSQSRRDFGFGEKKLSLSWNGCV